MTTNNCAHPREKSNCRDGWLDADEFARCVGMSERSARAALAAADAGRPWRGTLLVVRTVSGAGGSNGLKRQVLAASIPGDVQRLDHASGNSSSETPLAPLASSSSSPWSVQLQIIGPALRAPARSAERAASIADAASRHSIGERTLRGWIAAYEKEGAAKLCRQRRADRGKRRSVISRVWDDAVPLAEDVKIEIAEKLRRYVRSLLSAGVPGWRHAVRMAAVELADLTREAGAGLAETELRLACVVPRHFVERERRFQIIAKKDKDAKQFFDRLEPRVHRSRDGLAPMDIVVADVHHVNVLHRRRDGSIRTPKMIAWQDVATNRVFVTIVFCAPGEMVRQEHIAASFIDLTQDPHWGVPRTLQIDNGSEFAVLGFIDDAIKLADITKALGLQRVSMIIKSLPYNAPAKIVEGLFGILERGPLAMLPGWVGGDRMRKKLTMLERSLCRSPATRRSSPRP